MVPTSLWAFNPTLLESGDEVLIEHPTYALLVDAARYIGAVVKRFPRLEEDNYVLDPAAVRHAMTSHTKLIVTTNLHNHRAFSRLKAHSAQRSTWRVASAHTYWWMRCISTRSTNTRHRLPIGWGQKWWSPPV